MDPYDLLQISYNKNDETGFVLFFEQWYLDSQQLLKVQQSNAKTDNQFQNEVLNIFNTIYNPVFYFKRADYPYYIIQRDIKYDIFKLSPSYDFSKAKSIYPFYPELHFNHVKVLYYIDKYIDALAKFINIPPESLLRTSLDQFKLELTASFNRLSRIQKYSPIYLRGISHKLQISTIPEINIYSITDDLRQAKVYIGTYDKVSMYDLEKLGNEWQIIKISLGWYID
jgi:hypothetical protein